MLLILVIRRLVVISGYREQIAVSGEVFAQLTHCWRDAKPILRQHWTSVSRFTWKWGSAWLICRINPPSLGMNENYLILLKKRVKYLIGN